MQYLCINKSETSNIYLEVLEKHLLILKLFLYIAQIAHAFIKYIYI